MADQAFQFVLAGPPVVLAAAKNNPKRYRSWIAKVRAVALDAWPTGEEPTRGSVQVLITNYYSKPPPDVDNIIKPILDALNHLAYDDDNQVNSVTSRKIYMRDMAVTDPSSPDLIVALSNFSEVVHVLVEWS